MTASPSVPRYSKPIVILHWLTLILLAAVFAFIESREFFEKGTEARELVKSIHYMLGITVLLTVLARLYFRLRSNTPAITPAPKPASRLVAKVMHVLLYALMIGMPIAGWLILNAAGKPVPFFGLELPILISENKDLSDQIKDVHKTIGNAAYFLIAAHALAGLYHHYIRRDDTLRRILP